MTHTFDGDAISRADREFLASLGDHPLVQNPLYRTPCPPRPDFGRVRSRSTKQTEAQLACFAAVLDWMLVNYAYREGAFMGKGGIISLVDGEIISIASLRGFMQPYAIVEDGPRGGLKKSSPVDDLDDASAAGARSDARKPDPTGRGRPSRKTA